MPSKIRKIDEKQDKCDHVFDTKTRRPMEQKGFMKITKQCRRCKEIHIWIERF